MASRPTLEWFEGVCEQLRVNPMMATATLEGFREHECALEAVDSFLRSRDCTPTAQFQACFIMQYNSLKNWSLLSAAQIAQLKDTLFAVLQNATASGTMPPYALNKVTQCYVSFWKRGWKESSDAEKQVLFQQIMTYFQSSNAVTFRHGAVILRVLVEEFAMRSPAEAGLPLEFHRQAHMAFEESGLDQSLQLGMQCLSAAFQMTDAQFAIPCILESVKLFGEVISWDFGTNAISNAFLMRKPTHTSVDYTRSSGPSHLLTAPRRWSPLLLQTTFVDSICDVYVKTRTLLGLTIASPGQQQQQQQQEAVGDMLRCLMELRMLLVAMSSIGGQVFENDAERMSYGSCIMRQAVPLLDGAIETKWDPAVVGDFRAQECENLGTVLLRLLGNFRLSLCCQMPCFDAMMMTLGKTTFELSKELAVLAEQQLSRIHNPGAEVSTSSASWVEGEPAGLLEGWRGDAVVLFLDVWCMVLDDPLMLHSAFVGDQGVPSFSNGSTSAQVSTALKLGLRGMAAEVFKQLYESILRITICEALGEVDEDEGEDAAAIDVRNMDEMLGAICTVGRTNFSASLDYVRASLLVTAAEAEKLVSTPGISAASNRDTLRILETLRISVLFAAHLCDDTFRANADDASSETRLIPSFVLDSCLHAPETTQILKVRVRVRVRGRVRGRVRHRTSGTARTARTCGQRRVTSLCLAFYPA